VADTGLILDSTWESDSGSLRNDETIAMVNRTELNEDSMKTLSVLCFFISFLSPWYYPSIANQLLTSVFRFRQIIVLLDPDIARDFAQP